MLISHRRHSRSDIEHWNTVLEPTDAVNAVRLGTRLNTMVRKATAEILAFIHAAPDGYLGVSWGKDSVVVAWLLHAIERDHDLTLPVAHVMLDNGWQNPDSALVRDAFLERWPLRSYHEISAQEGVTKTADKEERLVHGFAEASRRFGDRYVSGVRAEESVTRRMSIGHRGLTTLRTCRPIGTWSTEAVFALAHREGLPAHPAYACTMGGLLDRSKLRTANIGGERGTWAGREEWEKRYYPEVWGAKRAAARANPR